MGQLKNIPFFFLVVTITLILNACQKDIPEPETIRSVLAITGHASASELTNKDKDPFKVRYIIKEDDVFIECMISNFSFLDKKVTGVQNGKMLVYLNNKLTKEVSTAAFSIKNLHKGNHRITLQIVSKNGLKTAMKKEFYVTIP